MTEQEPEEEPGVYIDMLDIGCPDCGATYTRDEKHRCQQQQWRLRAEEEDRL